MAMFVLDSFKHLSQLHFQLQVFSLFPILIVEGKRQIHSSRDSTRKISRINKESCEFLRNYAVVWHCVFLDAARRVRKT